MRRRPALRRGQAPFVGRTSAVRSEDGCRRHRRRGRTGGARRDPRTDQPRQKVLLVDQENAANLGGQAFWSFGGLFLVDSPEQRRLGSRTPSNLPGTTGGGSAAFDRLDDEDSWAVKWARAYVEFAAGEKRSWLSGHGITFLPTVGWAERGDLRADGHGNSVPRFHVAWGTGTGVVKPFADSALAAAGRGLVVFRHRHRVDDLLIDAGTVTGVRGTVLAPDDAPRGASSNRDPLGDFELRAQAVVITTGGIGGNHDIVRRYWPARMGTPPKSMITGVPAYVDGRMLDIADASGCGSSTATGCGTTPRVCRTGTRSGRGMPSGFCPDRRRCGSTLWAGDCPRRICRATTPWARCATCGQHRRSPVTTTVGSS